MLTFRTILRVRSKVGKYGTSPNRLFPVVVALPFDGPILPGGKWDVRQESFSMTQLPFIARCRADLKAAEDYLRGELVA